MSARLGPSVDEPLALALTRALVMAPREDKLPEFRRYAAARAVWGRPRAAVAPSVIGLGVNEALAWTAARSSTMEPEDMHRALLYAGAYNLLRWDTRLEGRWDNAVSTDVGWLDFTHALTFGDAVGELARRHPDLWPDGLLQMACFAGRNAAYLGDADRIMLAALARYVLARPKEKHVRRAARQALGFVARKG